VLLCWLQVPVSCLSPGLPSNLALSNLGNRRLDRARLDSSQAGNAENTDETYEAFGLAGD
jgi:hypothetical protein